MEACITRPPWSAPVSAFWRGLRLFWRGLAKLRILAAARCDAAQPVQTAAPRQSAAAAAAARMLEQHGNAILRLAYSYLHNLADAEDILQETLIRYLKTTPQLESPAHEKAWLLCVAANLCKNRIDYNRVRAADELDEQLAAEQRDDLSFVWRAVRQLPDPYRAAIHLFYAEGYDTAGIAKILHRKESTVRSDLRRGRQKLKELLGEAYDFE